VASKAAQKPEQQVTRPRAAKPLAGMGMTPLLPPEGRAGLDEKAFDLIREAGAFAAQTHPETVREVAHLVRSMNCYYSNLIEGHNTHPRDIDRALSEEFALEPRRRNLQLEAAAHIHVQEIVDDGGDPQVSPCSREYLQWLHEEFYRHLPDEFLWVENPETKKRKKFRPGEVRDGEVQVGQHLPPPAAELDDYLQVFAKSYDLAALTKLRAVAALGAAHHRFAWIHPFYDGNGRVARLMSHAMLSRIGLGSGMWSVARGLARTVGEYKRSLARADQGRWTDTDGRGVLSERALVEFCEYFLTVALDQVRFMTGLLDMRGMLTRMEVWCESEAKAKRIETGSFAVLRELWLMGSLERAKVPQVANVKERQARQIVSRLTAAGVVRSETSRMPLRLKIPLSVVEAWFPGMYPPLDKIPETGAPASIVLGMM
jgi:Fic family protein